AGRARGLSRGDHARPRRPGRASLRHPSVRGALARRRAGIERGAFRSALVAPGRTDRLADHPGSGRDRGERVPALIGGRLSGIAPSAEPSPFFRRLAPPPSWWWWHRLARRGAPAYPGSTHRLNASARPSTDASWHDAF